MNLRKLSEAQAELDLHINLEKQINHSDYLLEKAISLCVELGEMLNERPFIFKYWSSKTGDRDKALTEYVDVLHFLLSYGNSIGFDFENYKYERPNVIDQRVLVLGLFSMFGSFVHTKQFSESLTYFLHLGETLNFTKDEIVAAYYGKNKENYARQEAGY